MEIQMRHRPVHNQDQENIYAIKGKGNVTVPVKKLGVVLRGALGDLNTNLQSRRDVNVGKVACATADFERNTTLNCGAVRCNYSHVPSKVDTGLVTRIVNQASSRPPIRRDESTANLAARATRTRDAHKPNELKETIKVPIQAKKCYQEKKTCNLATVKEQSKDKHIISMLKGPTESLRKLKLVETTNRNCEQSSRLINFTKLEKHSALFKSGRTLTPNLPNDIEDIDAGDNNSPLLMAIYIKDIYKYLVELESKYPIELDHLKKQIIITGKMRATLIDWLVEVQHQFSLLLETLHLTVGIIDRYLQAVPNVQRNQLQLVGVTAMFIASKYEEIYAPDISDFVDVTDNAYSKAEVFRCERDIMAKLGFCLARPIPLSFLRRFVKAAHGTSKNHHLAKYFVDLCLIEYSMAHYRPSELAAAAICLSLYLLSSKKLEKVWTPTMSYYSCYSLEHIKPIIRKLAKIVINVENSKYKAVYNKYLDITLARVSSLPQLKGETIFELAIDC